MIENALVKNNASFKVKITVKALISAGIIALALILPQLAHLTFGQSAGIMLLPMYLPVLLGGCLLGSLWGAAIGLLSPIASFVITSAIGSPMPPLARLPFMAAELCIFAAVSGLFVKKIAEKPLFVFPAVFAAELCGRGFFLLSVFLFSRFTALTAATVWKQIKLGIPGLLLQAVIVPLSVIILNKLLVKEKQNDRS